MKTNNSKSKNEHNNDVTMITTDNESNNNSNNNKDASGGAHSSKAEALNKSHNRHTTSRHRIKPAELYRTDFITAMKLPDNESLEDDSYWLIKDQWKLDWEKGVQVPIKPNELNNANCKVVEICNDKQLNSLTNNGTVQNKQQQLKLPKKYLCPANDSNYDQTQHEAYITHRLVDTQCRYDSDEMDICWLDHYNLELKQMQTTSASATSSSTTTTTTNNYEQLSKLNFERIIENYEQQTSDNLKLAIKALESYSIEYDEEVVCDVCRSPDCEDTNEMVFCDGCNLCVHQACYGIEKIPKGNWLCATCQLQIKPQCILCPNIGGAMKATRNLRYWCHVSCALWIPEAGFANPDKMEPIVNINKIPAARWQLLCHLCKERRGCCFQCSEKKCHAAFHITCAFKYNLEMQTILTENDDDIIFKGYCFKHSKKRQGSNHHHHHNHQSSITTNRQQQQQQQQLSPTNDLCKLNEQERKKETEKRIQKLDLEFYKYANCDDAYEQLKINKIHLDFVYNYWKMKRRFKLNKPLLLAKTDEDLMNQSERLLNARIKMFIHLRQDLERVRNLCYMVIKREKLKRKLFFIKNSIFHKQCDFIQKYGFERSGRTRDILLTKHDNCIYDFVKLQNDSIISTNNYNLISNNNNNNTNTMDNDDIDYEYSETNIKKLNDEDEEDDDDDDEDDDGDGDGNSVNLNNTNRLNKQSTLKTHNTNKQTITNRIKTKYKNIQFNNTKINNTNISPTKQQIQSTNNVLVEFLNETTTSPQLSTTTTTTNNNNNSNNRTSNNNSNSKRRSASDHQIVSFLNDQQPSNNTNDNAITDYVKYSNDTTTTTTTKKQKISHSASFTSTNNNNIEQNKDKSTMAKTRFSLRSSTKTNDDTANTSTTTANSTLNHYRTRLSYDNGSF